MTKDKCVVPSCNYRRNKKNVKRSMFKCPKNALIAERWENSIPGIDKLLSNDHVCEIHFDDRYIIRYQDTVTNVVRSKLQKTAVPTIFDQSDGVNYDRYSSFDVQYQHPYIPQVNEDVNFYENPSTACQNTGEDSLQVSQVELRDSLSQLPRIENTMSNVVKDLIASQEVLMNIKKEELSMDEVTVKIEPTEGCTEKFNADRQMEMKSFTVYQYVKYNLQYLLSLLPESWNIFHFTMANDCDIVSFSKECTVNENIGLLVLYEKNAVINRSGKVHYSIHGKRLKDIDPEYVPKFPENVPNTEVMLKVVQQFDEIKVCQGILISEFDAKNHSSLFKDDLGIRRHIKCTLVTDAQQCDNCFSYNQSLVSNMMNRQQVLTDIPSPYNQINSHRLSR